MEIKRSYEGYEEITLYETKLERDDYYSAHSIKVTYEEDKDRFNIFSWKAGNTIEQVYGDWDIEEWLFIKREDGKDFVDMCAQQAKIDKPKGKHTYLHVFEILYSIYNDDKEAFYTLKKLMEDQKFPHKFQYYH